jgi:hypothetical protein
MILSEEAMNMAKKKPKFDTSFNFGFNAHQGRGRTRRGTRPPRPRKPKGGGS